VVVKQMKPGSTAITAKAMTKAGVVPPEIRELPGGLYPLHSAAFEMDEYRIMAGWPVPVPAYDIRAETLMSADGTALADRDPPTSLVTGATFRWIADTNYYDLTSLRWAPIQGGAPPWTAMPGSDPTLVTDYSYRVGEEMFTSMTCLNFDSDTADYLSCDLNLAMGGSNGYSVIMVMSPNSVYGNNPDVPANGLFGPMGDADSPPGWFSLSIRGNFVWLSSDDSTDQRGVSIGTGQRSTAPMFLAVVVGRPQASLYAASGPSSLLTKRIPTGDASRALRADFWLGRTPLTPATADLALFDLGIYGDMLTPAQVASEFALLSGIYGGDT
jgi:hypothetical protein